jgi:hypothetical protein
MGLDHLAKARIRILIERIDAGTLSAEDVPFELKTLTTGEVRLVGRESLRLGRTQLAHLVATELKSRSA